MVNFPSPGPGLTYTQDHPTQSESSLTYQLSWHRLYWRDQHGNARDIALVIVDGNVNFASLDLSNSPVGVIVSNSYYYRAGSEISVSHLDTADITRSNLNLQVAGCHWAILQTRSSSNRSVFTIE